MKKRLTWLGQRFELILSSFYFGSAIFDYFNNQRQGLVSTFLVGILLVRAYHADSLVREMQTLLGGLILENKKKEKEIQDLKNKAKDELI